MTIVPITLPAVESGSWIWSRGQARTSRYLAPAPARSSIRLPRVLLIDDTPEIAELLSFALGDPGYERLCRRLYRQCQRTDSGAEFDALVLDFSTLEMSESLFDIVRCHPDHAELPIVIISDMPEKADASLRSRAARKVLLIPKPFTGSQVARALSELLK